MRYLVVISGIWSLLMGQPSGLQWVELADTVYGITTRQDTFRLYIQSRSGSVRRFERYDYGGGVRTLWGYDSVYLDASGRIDRIRLYQRDNNNNITFRAQYQFSYPNPPAIKVEVTEGGSSSPVREAFFYGLRRLEGSFVWNSLDEDNISIPIERYPRLYLIDQIGDSVVSISRVDNLARAYVGKDRPGDCDTIIVYSGPANGPLNPARFGGKVCHRGGRIDSVILGGEREYWTYDANGRPVQAISVEGPSERDTVRYTYDGYGRLSEVWESGVGSSGSYAQRFFLRYQGIPGSLAFEAERGCLDWDAVRRRGWFRCKGAGDVTVVQAYDIQGRLVWEGRVEGNSMFELPASLPAGLYHLRAGVQGMKVYLLP